MKAGLQSNAESVTRGASAVESATVNSTGSTTAVSVADTERRAATGKAINTSTPRSRDRFRSLRNGRAGELAIRVGLPLAVAAMLLFAWHLAVLWSGTDIFPGPTAVALGIIELAQKGLLTKYVVASLFRVTWGFMLAVMVGVPFGLLLGWFPLMRSAFNPIIQMLRPISPIAWIPIAILWFGVRDGAPIFLIFLASVFPIAVTTMAAVQNMQPVYLRAARNFGLTRFQLFRMVIFPAALPQILTGIRIALGVAWLVVVAAEMLGITSGLGYLIIDARNAGKRYDLVVAGMFLIGIIGLILDGLIRQCERFDTVRWGYPER